MTVCLPEEIKSDTSRMNAMASNFYELRLDMVVGDMAFLAWADFGLSRVRPNTRKICLKDMPPSTLLFYKGQFGHLIKSRGTAISCSLVFTLHK
jgi:hypothetical protein